MSEYFPSYRGHIPDNTVRLDLSSYATKSYLNDITYINTSSFALKTNLSALKSKIDKLDISKLKIVPIDLANLTQEVHQDFIKKKQNLIV